VAASKQWRSALPFLFAHSYSGWGIVDCFQSGVAQRRQTCGGYFAAFADGAAIFMRRASLYCPVAVAASDPIEAVTRKTGFM